MPTRIHHYSAALVAHIAATFAAYSREGRPVHIALSGGSTPKALYQALAAAPWRDKIAWHNLHLWWRDERCVPPAAPESNYGDAARPLLDHVPVPPANIHRMRAQADPAAEAAFEPIGSGKYLANIYLLATQTLHRAGVSQIYGGRHCTVLERDRFFSYRRDGQTGRMVSAVWLSPE